MWSFYYWFVIDMQISLRLKIQSLALLWSSCEKFTLLAKLECHAFLKMIVCVPINTFKNVKNLRFLQSRKNQNFQIILLYVNSVSISQVFDNTLRHKISWTPSKMFPFNRISGDFMTTETFRSSRYDRFDWKQ